MTVNSTDLLNSFYTHLSEIYHLKGVSQLLVWDRRVFMPRLGSPVRSKQSALIDREVHLRYLDKDFVRITNDLTQLELGAEDAINVREVHRDIERKAKIPAVLAEKYSEVRSVTENVWEEARPNNDFASVEPLLQKLIDLSQEKAELWGYDEHPYDALLQSFEPGSDLNQTKTLLLRLAEELKEIIPAAVNKTKDTPVLDGDYPEETQGALCLQVLKDVGYSFESGRFDKAPHPFSATMSLGDSRVTTRYSPTNYLSSLLTALHEVGHGFYELGFPREREGTPLAEYVSMGIHESQSLLWENFVGRSMPFCRYLHPVVERYFPGATGNESPEAIWNQLNVVQPSLIRVEADRVTYPLHIVIRLLLEEQLIEGSLKAKDLPEAWEALYMQYLNITPSNNREGVLQDVHWYGGMFGYFPSYALGQIYAAMLMEKIDTEMPDLDRCIESADFESLLTWLQLNVHRLGRTYQARELMKVVTAKEVSEAPLVAYLKRQYQVT